MGAQKPMEKPQWRSTALAIATAVLVGFSSDASALALGRVTVQSALGEPLRADIELPEITAEEVASLRVAIASPEAFRAAGFEFNPALNGITVTLQRRPDGRHFLRLSSQRAVNDPFVDLILEANWSSGRIVRDYTMLFDPPNLRQPAPPMTAQVVPPPAATGPAARPATPPAATAPPPARTTPPQRMAERPSASRSAGDTKQVTVKSGDTAARIAAANKPVDVSLDQMLIAMLRSNPEAFIGGNVNRLKAGAVLEMPSPEEVGLVPSGEARQTIVAQSRNFNEFRRRLAEGLPTTQVGAADRQASGKVEAQVAEKQAAVPTPDKLTLSKGALQDKGTADKIARERAAQDAATRVAELNKNISELGKLGTATAPAAAAAGASAPKAGVALPMAAGSATRAASGPAATAPSAPVAAVAPASPASASPASPSAAATSASAAPATVAASAAATPAPAASAAASAPAATAQQAPASAAAVAAPAVAAAAKPQAAPPPPETTLVDDMLENPIVPATIGGLLAFLLGFAFYRSQQRKKSTQVDSSFLESRLQPDSFFGASGGQRIDTNEGSATGSSMVYSPSQLDAAGDVDPVAEADVYLAYGRDLQAEEILKEAMRTTPQRVAVHSKLLEIYSKRRDAKAFELVATEAYGLTHGDGPDWEHICELGHELDPSNPLYRPGGQPADGAAAATAAIPAAGFGATTPTPAVPAAAAPVDLDLDLDFSLGDEEPAPAPGTRAAQPTAQSTQALNAAPAADPMPALDMDFGTATVALQAPTPAPAAAELPRIPQVEPTRLDAPDLTLSGNSLDFDLEPAKSPAAKAPAPVAATPAVAAAQPADAGMIEFDLGALSLDLDSPAPAAKTAAVPANEPDTADAPISTAGAPLSTGGFEDTGGDPLATKLALAQEFNAIGDPDGARSLAEEVLAEASGDLKHKAQRFLAEIS
jgi:pilus assembly protein FimV